MKIALAVIVILGVSHVDAMSSGAPDAACDGMMPNHSGTTAQSTSNPYELTVSATEYTAGSQITVTLRGMNSETLKGFLIQARSTDGQTRYGTFSGSVSGQQTSCSNEAVTHTGSEDKTTVIVTWTAPADLSGNIKFMATVVQQFDTFWTGLVSDIIMDANSMEASDEDSDSSATNLSAYSVFNLLALFWAFRLAYRLYPAA